MHAIHLSWFLIGKSGTHLTLANRATNVNSLLATIHGEGNGWHNLGLTRRQHPRVACHRQSNYNGEKHLPLVISKYDIHPEEEHAFTFHLNITVRI